MRRYHPPRAEAIRKKRRRQYLSDIFEDGQRYTPLSWVGRMRSPSLYGCRCIVCREWDSFFNKNSPLGCRKVGCFCRMDKQPRRRATRGEARPANKMYNNMDMEAPAKSKTARPAVVY